MKSLFNIFEYSENVIKRLRCWLLIVPK